MNSPRGAPSTRSIQTGKTRLQAEPSPALLPPASTGTTQGQDRNFKDAVDLIPNIVWLADAAGQTQYLNARAVEYTGLAAEENYDEGLSLIHPADLESVLADRRRALETGLTTDVECRIRRRDGDYRWMNDVATRDSPSSRRCSSDRKSTAVNTSAPG